MRCLPSSLWKLGKLSTFANLPSNGYFLWRWCGGVEFVEVVDRVDGAGEVFRGSEDGEGSSIGDVVVVSVDFTERFDITEDLHARTGGFDGLAGELTPREVVAVLTLVVEVFETTETGLILFVDWAVELLLPADEGSSDAVLNAEDASLGTETRDCGLEAGSVGLSPQTLIL